MPKPRQAVPKVGPQSQPQPQTEELGEGSSVATNPDAPPETFHAGMVQEIEPETAIKERGLGPTEPLGPWDEDFGDEQTPEETATEEATPDEGVETPAESEGGKEADSKAKERSEFIPRDRFDEVNEQAKQFAESHKMLQWILEDPARFAKMASAEAKPQEEPEPQLMVPEPELPQGKTLDEMSDKEVFDFAVRKESARILNEHLGKVFQDLKGLKTFQGSVEDLMMKSATGTDKKPLFPRWEELKPAVQNLMSRHPTLDKREAYFLAERTAVAAGPYVPPQEESASAPYSPPKNQVSEQPPLGQSPKRGSKEAIRAAQMMHLGRASQAYQGSAKPQSVEEAVRMAMRDQGFVDDL